MSDLISRSAAIEKITPYGTQNGSCLGHHRGAVDCAILEIEMIPSVDAVEVIRCKDCKHFNRNIENETYCSCIGGLTDQEEHDFCSYGERRKNG